MYTPKLFKITDRDIIEQFITQNSFATLISMGETHPTGTHIPIELELNEKNEKVLRGHLAKANPQWKTFETHPQVLAMFLSSVNHYISSSWYQQPNAPTWNYMSVHIMGKIKLIEGDALWQSVSKLTDKYEQNSENPVSLATLPPSVQKQMEGIVGFEISIDEIDAQFKLSQNRNEEDFNHILKELKLSKEPNALLMAAAMELQRNYKEGK